MASFQSTTAKILTSSFIALIVFAFMFTFDAPQSLVGVGGHLGQVGPYKIEGKEFEQEYNQQLRRLTLQMGGRSLSNEQIETFRIRHQALGVAIDKKLYLIMAEESGIQPGSASVRKAIKQQDFFKDDGHFDLIKYKEVLRLNGLTPADYEELIAQDLMVKQAFNLSSLVSVSQNFAQEMLDIKQDKRMISVVQIKNSDVENRVKVSAEEVSQFLSTNEGKKKVNKLFVQRKSSFEQKEQVKARHILFKGPDSLKRAQEVRKQKINAKNFQAFAKRHSEDASTKPRGGDLGWFSKGQMVAEFEKTAFSIEKGRISEPIKTTFGHHLILVENRKEFVPAKFTDHEHKLAQELVREKKGNEVEKLRRQMAKEFAQKTGKKAWEKLGEKYTLKPQFKQSLNLLDSRAGQATLSFADRELIFEKAKGNVFTSESSPATTTVIHILDIPKTKENKTAKQEWQEQKGQLAFQLAREWMEQLWEENSVSCRGLELKGRSDLTKCQI